MSPRGFKIGLALFLVMSGLFGAKLSMIAPNGSRSSWRSLESTASLGPGRPAAAAPAPVKRDKASRSPGVPQDGAADDDVGAAKEAESAAHTAPPLSEADKSLVAAIKLELKTRGYAVDPGKDGLDLPARAAIIAFEADNDMRLTGEASQGLLHRLLLGASDTDPNNGLPPAPRAEEVIRSVQASLKRAGHPDLKSDGQMSRETVETIRAFERAHSMKVTGRISSELVAQLQHVARDGKTAVAGH